jgi:hypothetical protein
MDARPRPLEALFRARQVPDAELRSQAVQAFQDAIQEHPWDAGASDASADGHRPDL